ncbi:hypothetical protein ACWEQL_06570 [Kitasatospora sp. NPDC004240]
MLRRISMATLTAALAGGLLLAAAPAQPAAAAGHTITCNERQMGQQIADLRAKANRLRHEGEYDAARRASAQADAVAAKLKACQDAESTTKPPRWK